MKHFILVAAIVACISCNKVDNDSLTQSQSRQLQLIAEHLEKQEYAKADQAIKSAGLTVAQGKILLTRSQTTSDIAAAALCVYYADDVNASSNFLSVIEVQFSFKGDGLVSLSLGYIYYWVAMVRLNSKFDLLQDSDIELLSKNVLRTGRLDRRSFQILSKVRPEVMDEFFGKWIYEFVDGNENVRVDLESLLPFVKDSEMRESITRQLRAGE